MNAFPFLRPLSSRLLLLLCFACSAAEASDHADPMSLNVLAPLKTPEANITDLHAFIVDGQHRPITDPARLAAIEETDQLIISLCVRRALRPDQIGSLRLDEYTFRLHLDYDAPVRIADSTRTRDGRNYAEALAAAASPQDRSALISAHQADLSAQALYGGILTDPTAIAEDCVIDFRLQLKGEEEKAQAYLRDFKVQGIEAPVESLQLPDISAIIEPDKFKAGTIYAVAGVFDDPFIFPRFFRGNVVGIVTSIPVKALRKNGRSILPDRTASAASPARPCPVLLWATTHKGKEQIDHVGRSLRTQLPRFGYLNDKHPSAHVGAITKVHDRPNLLENIEGSFISPLFAHRHYDSTPDVMIYDLTQPASFPNGRMLKDDVAKTLADAGETLLLELSYAESPQFPRSTINDKPFREKFPFLAPRWSRMEIADHAPAGTRMGDFEVPRARDASATATPDFTDSSWRSIWLGEVLLVGTLALLCALAARRYLTRFIFIIVGGVLCYWLGHLLETKAMPMAMNYFTQPAYKAMVAAGGAAASVLLLLALVYLWGRRHGYRSALAAPVMPAGVQEATAQDEAYDGSSFNEVRNAVFRDPYYGAKWAEPGQLPVYKVSFTNVAKGLFSRFSTKYFPFGNAAQRTIKSHADLRWGADGKGVERLLHPNGLTLTGRWIIDADAPPLYSGGFKPNTECLIIGRYSTCCTETRSSRNRSLSLVGKLYPTLDKNKKFRTKSFITQEDIGGNFTKTIFEGVTFNAPSVTPHKRDFSGFFAFLVTALTFIKTDREPAMRQLYEVAELGEDAEKIASGAFKIACPKFMRLTPVDGPKPPDPGTDFRDEIINYIYENGLPKNKLVFNIAVADKGELKGLLFKKLKVEDSDWKTIGHIEFDEAVASHNSDFVIHFHHPAWRQEIADAHTALGPPDKLLVRLLKWWIP